MERKKVSPCSSSKNESSALTNALKHVFHIHKDIVTDLKSKLEDATEAYEKLKKNQGNMSSSSCLSCAHLQQMNKTLERHFQSRLKDKNIIIKHLENRLQSLGEVVDGASFSVPADETCASDEANHLLLAEPAEEADNSSLIGVASKEETSVSHGDGSTNKQQNKLQLSRLGKRRCRYQDHPDSPIDMLRCGDFSLEHSDAKRQSVSPKPDEKRQEHQENFLSKVLNPTQSQIGQHSILVPETELATGEDERQQQKVIEINDEDGGELEDVRESRDLLVVPETMALDAVVVEPGLPHEEEEEECDLEVNHVNGKQQRSHRSVSLSDDAASKSYDPMGETVLEANDQSCVLPESQLDEEETTICENQNSDTKVISQQVELNVPSVTVSIAVDIERMSIESKERRIKNHSHSSNVHKKRVTLIPPDTKFAEPSPVTHTGSARLRLSRDENHTITPNISDLRTPETPASTSPRLFDKVKVSKDKSATPHRTSNVALHKRKTMPETGNTTQPPSDSSVNGGFSTGRGLKENMSPGSKSLRQSTMTQAFLAPEGVGKSTARDLEKREEEELAEAIQRSLRDSQASQDVAENDDGGMDHPKKSRSMNTKAKIKNEDSPILVKDSSPCRSTIYSSPSKVGHDRAQILKLKERSPNIPEPAKEKVLRSSSLARSAKKDLFANKTKLIVTERMQEKKDADVTSPSILAVPSTESALSFEKEDRSMNMRDNFLRDQKNSTHNSKHGRGRVNAKDHSSRDLKLETADASQILQESHAETSSTNFDDTIAPNLMTQGAPHAGNKTQHSFALDMEDDDLMLPSLQPVKPLSHTSAAQVKKDKVIVVKDKALDVEIEDSDDDEDDTISPSPQQSLPGQISSQFAQSFQSSLRSGRIPQRMSATSLLKGSKNNTPSRKEKVKSVDVKIIKDKDNDLDMSSFLDVVDDSEIPGPAQSAFDSFDRVPTAECPPEFAHVGVVRKQSERNKLQGFSCKQCHDYYKNSGLSEEEMQQKMRDCSRHRDKFRPPSTPEHFWSLGFPDTAEDVAREPSQFPRIAPRPPRRRRRLEKKF